MSFSSLKETEIFFRFIFENGKEGCWFFTFITENIHKLVQPDKIFSIYVKVLEKDKEKSTEQKSLGFGKFLGKFSNSSIIEMLFTSFISKDSGNFHYFQAKNFANYINANFKISNLLINFEILLNKNLDEKKQILLYALQNWATKNYVNFASQVNQKCKI
jgi:hypothetical protein